jgi:hypothetical protein
MRRTTPAKNHPAAGIKPKRKEEQQMKNWKCIAALALCGTIAAASLLPGTTDARAVRETAGSRVTELPSEPSTITTLAAADWAAQTNSLLGQLSVPYRLSAPEDQVGSLVSQITGLPFPATLRFSNAPQDSEGLPGIGTVTLRLTPDAKSGEPGEAVKKSCAEGASRLLVALLRQAGISDADQRDLIEQLKNAPEGDTTSYYPTLNRRLTVHFSSADNSASWTISAYKL